MKKMATISFFLFCACALQLHAQQGTDAIRSGNRLYKQKSYQQALPEYQKAAAQDPANPVARYNLGNAQFRNNQFAEAEKEYDATINTTNEKDKDFTQKATYNKGVALSRQKKLLESIEAYKKAVKLNPADADARFNLQKALSELKKQTEGDQKKEEQKKQQKQQQQQKPPPQQNKVNKRQIEQWLNSLRQKEQEVQRKVQDNRTRSASKPEKDW
jgi:Ca-activated chloride channel homolog